MPTGDASGGTDTAFFFLAAVCTIPRTERERFDRDRGACVMKKQRSGPLSSPPLPPFVLVLPARHLSDGDAHPSPFFLFPLPFVFFSLLLLLFLFLFPRPGRLSGGWMPRDSTRWAVWFFPLSTAPPSLASRPPVSTHASDLSLRGLGRAALSSPSFLLRSPAPLHM